MKDDHFTYLNGAFLSADAATVSVQDRGFRFGDGVFETIPIHAGIPYQWSFHLERLASGLLALQIPIPAIDWAYTCCELLHKNNLTSGFVRISVSRGVGSKGYRPLPDIKPTVVIEVMPKGEATDAMSLWLSSLRKPTLDALPVSHKLMQGTNSTLALLEADQHGCNEALLLTQDEMLCEAASGNLFWIQGDQLFTPALDTGCLNGATRHAVIRLHDQQVHSARAPFEALETAESVFLTNANWGVMPVDRLEPNGWSWPVDHPLIARLQAAYQQDIDDYVTRHHTDWS